MMPSRDRKVGIIAAAADALAQVVPLKQEHTAG